MSGIIKIPDRWTYKVCKSCLFGTFEEAGDHEILCAGKKSLIAKWTRDVGKSCSFEIFKDAEAHEK
jgi:hypothetical protein